jgi:Rhs element Vgr protein
MASIKPKKDTIPGHKRISSPEFSIAIDGAKVEKDPGIVSIMVNKSVNRIPTAEIVIYDGSGSNEDFKISSSEKYIPGKSEISIKLSYGDSTDSATETIFKGIIVKQSIKAPLNGPSTVLLELRDKSIATTINRQNNYFLGKKDSEAMETALKADGVTLDITATTTTYEKIVQYYATGWDFALSRAEANGFLVFVNDGKITIKKPEFSFSNGLELTLGVNIVEIDAEMNAQYQYNAVAGTFWNSSKQELKSHTTGGTLVSPSEGDLDSAQLASVLKVGNYLQQTSAKLQDDELATWTKAKLLRSQMSRIKGRVRIYGTNAVKPGDIIRLAGVGGRFNGDAFVSSVTHSFSAKSVWYTDIQIGYSDEWFYERYDNIVDTPAAGLIPAINGLHIGIVTDIDDVVDGPTNSGGDFRVRVKLPLLDDVQDASKGFWARIVSLDAGKDKGFVTRPDVDDEVIVGFLNDDPRNPVILGMVHSQTNAVPTKLKPGAKDKNFEKGWLMKNGIKVFFHDEKDKSKVTIETPKKNSIVIDDEKDTITITNTVKGPPEVVNTIKMGEKGIEITSDADIILIAKGQKSKITVTGEMDVALESKKGKFIGKGKSGAEVTSSGQAVLKGSIVKIN